MSHSFVGSLDIEAFPAVVAQMRQVLGLHDDWAARIQLGGCTDFLRHARSRQVSW